MPARLTGRTGTKKGIVAIGHGIAKAIYHIIKEGLTFKELRKKYFTEQNNAARLRYIKKQAQLFGRELVPFTNQVHC